MALKGANMVKKSGKSEVGKVNKDRKLVKPEKTVKRGKLGNKSVDA